ncbi:hypothetical protein AZSI13_32570 [Azospira sp. I13]|uniref:hypothetical protein n=1 Tax=Azospira sp. I13 TaxID=1765050 RepID=UPI000D48D89B|nr:hypothetical protein [Azospira sp. I13]GBG03930.1 hypothetical protein AZSI13_32570 [Azospira sp. I13]
MLATATEAHKVVDLVGLSPAQADNVAVAQSIVNIARCVEWLAGKGYHVLSFSGDANGPRLTIAPKVGAQADLDGVNVGRICQPNQTIHRYVSRRFDVIIEWRDVK